jgi:hypothetical protein
VHVVAPGGERPVYTLVTSGMSERPMATPGAGDVYAELALVLPPFWPAPGSEEMRTPAGHWPYRLLQDLARLPHEFDTWLRNGHTVPNGDPPEPYAPGTRLCGALIAPALTLPEDFEELEVGERHEGVDRLYDLFDEAGVSEILDPERPSVVPKRRRGLFRR